MRRPIATERTRLLAVGALLTVLAFGVRIVPAWALHNEVADVMTYREMARTVLRGDDIYARPIFFPYTPFSQFAPAEMLRLADATGWRFDFTIKLPPILADVAVTPMILALLTWSGCSLAVAASWTLFWALHPVPILITAFHGNLMEIVPALLLAAFLAAERARRTDQQRATWLAISALSLGLAIAWRSFPILLLPVFLLFATRTLRQALLYTSLAAIAPGLSCLPYFIHVRHTMLREILSYSGTSDFGWASVLRGLPYLAGGPLQGLGDPMLLEESKQLFLLAYVAVLSLLPLFRPRSLGPALMLAPLLFYGLYGGVAAQYYAWILPIAIAIRDPMVIPHSLVSAVAMVTFYALYHPLILHGPFPAVVPADRRTGLVYVVANAVLVVLSLWWAVSIVWKGLRRDRDDSPEATLASRWALHPWRRRATWAFAAIVAIGAVPLAAAATRRANAALRADLPRALAYASIAASAPPVRESLRAGAPSLQAAPELPAAAPATAPTPPHLMWSLDAGEHRIREPRSLRSTASGSIVAIDYVGHQLAVIAPNGVVERVWSTGDADILGLDVDQRGQIWTLDAQRVRVEVHSLDGEPVETLDLLGLGAYNPRGLAVAADGTFFIADTGAGRVLHLDAGGGLLGTLGDCDGCPSDLELPSDVVVAGDQVAVADAAANRLLVLARDGGLVGSIAIPVPPDEGGYRLAAIDVETFAITGHRSVWLLHRDGTSRALMQADQDGWHGYPGSPTGVTWVAGERHLIVSDRHSRTIRAFDADLLFD